MIDVVFPAILAITAVKNCDKNCVKNCDKNCVKNSDKNCLKKLSFLKITDLE